MNKKLIKTIASITCGLGIATAIPILATSCNELDPTITVHSNTAIIELKNFATSEDDWYTCSGKNSNTFYIKINTNGYEFVPNLFDVTTISMPKITIDEENWRVDYVKWSINGEWVYRDGFYMANFDILYSFSKKAAASINWSSPVVFCAEYAQYSKTNLFGPKFSYIS